MGTRVGSSIVLAALVACICSASARVVGAQAPARHPSVTTDVVSARPTPAARASSPS